MIANAGVVGEFSGVMDGQSPSRLLHPFFLYLVCLLADVEKWESLWATNIRGSVLCYKYAAKQMVKQGSGGRIIGRNSSFMNQ
jgi:NAD(P)-dependent dehydrogenase (short-subunit alcohol dehydrogenase family)